MSNFSRSYSDSVAIDQDEQPDDKKKADHRLSVPVEQTNDEIKTRKDKAQSNWTKIFRPWRWKKKKRSEKFTKTATSLERKISVRSTRDDLIKRGLLTETNGEPASKLEKPVVQSSDEKDELGEVDQQDDTISSAMNHFPSLPKQSDSIRNRRRSPSDPSVAMRSDNDQNRNNATHAAAYQAKSEASSHYIHQKYPSDEVTRDKGENDARRHFHRHSYQIATSSSNSLNRGDERLNVGRFQMRGSGGNDLVAVGIIGHNAPGSRSAVSYSGPTPIPAERTFPRSSDSLKNAEQRFNDEHSLTTAASLPPALAARLSQDLSNAISNSLKSQAASKAQEKSHPYRESSKQDHAHSNIANPSSQDHARFTSKSETSKPVQHISATESLISPRPVAAKRTEQSVVGKSATHVVKGPPPKPPPKPSKQMINKATEQYKRSSVEVKETSQVPLPPPQYSKPRKPEHFVPNIPTGDVRFAGSAEIIQRTTQMNIPQYLRENCTESENNSSTAACDSDSDSSGPILYRDDDDDDDEVDDAGGLAAKVARRDTLALRLANRPNRTELEQRNIISSPQKTEEERSAVKVNLTRRLSQRPTKSELQQRNILPNETPEARVKEREEVKRQLTRKLSMRPTVKELIERKVLINWHEYVEVYEVQNYDRRGDKPWTRLTPADKASIRKELNEFKANEMTVHEDSRRYTRFHKP
ncbi:uncharacterized protein LOC100183390 isoform X3 [Ciona intestinalis]